MEENVQKPNIEQVHGSAPAQTPPVSQEPKPKSKLPFAKIGVILLILLLVGGAAAAYTFVAKPKPQVETPRQIAVIPSPTPDPAAVWKTHINNKYNVSFKYPGNLLILERSDKGYDYVYFFKSATEKQNFEKCNFASDCFKSDLNILFTVVPNPNQEVLSQDLLRKYYKSNDIYSPIKLDGASGLQKVDHLKWGNLYNYYFDTGKSILRVGASINSTYVGGEAEEILKTLTFTDDQAVHNPNEKVVETSLISIPLPDSWSQHEDSSAEVVIGDGLGTGIRITRESMSKDQLVSKITKDLIPYKTQKTKRTVAGQAVDEYQGCTGMEACYTYHYIILPTNNGQNLLIEFAETSAPNNQELYNSVLNGIKLK